MRPFGFGRRARVLGPRERYPPPALIDGLAPYEHERNARIAENKQTMHALGIGKLAAEIAAAKVEGKSEKKKAGFPTGLAPKADGLRRVGPNACGTSPYAPTLAGAIARARKRGPGV